jgi:hypothetical protein
VRDFPVGTDDERGRIIYDPVPFLDFAVVEQNRKIHVDAAHKTADGGQTFVQIDAEHHDAFIRVMLVYLLQQRHFSYTRIAETAPKIEDHMSAPEIGQPVGLPVQTGDAEVGRDLPFGRRSLRVIGQRARHRDAADEDKDKQDRDLHRLAVLFHRTALLANDRRLSRAN